MSLGMWRSVFLASFEFMFEYAAVYILSTREYAYQHQVAQAYTSLAGKGYY